MMETTNELFFDAKYSLNDDPWSFATNDYEQHRYQRIENAIGTKRSVLAYEPGCSIGVFTERLALRCEQVEACDISSIAVERARNRCRKLTNVHIHHAALSDFPPNRADLYVFCEVGYYFERQELAQIFEDHAGALQDNATIVACHWLGYSEDHLLSGDEVHDVLHQVQWLSHEYSERTNGFRLDRWRKCEVER